ncbi:DinB family protein [Amycolatopsis sp. NBC_01480]|uniref:DinB family protein n=1 Tax=Amycolatopsis sp. NBC_01480 TaxID=2903562 RepID=UPI002E2CB410|nr:DinB family protein [Amycolatopsis sp. NBC_01480]
MAGSVPPVTDERSGLLAYLAQQRHVIRIAAHGLSDEQARAVPSASDLSVGGLVKHAANTESGWIDVVLQQPQKPFDDAMADYFDNYRLGESETLASVLDRYDRIAARTEEVIAGIEDLGQAVPVPQGVPWYPKDVEAWSVRWVLLHLIEETARHAGHADIIRESLDGATAMPLMAAAEGWPESDWVKPWRGAPVAG